MYTDPGGTMLLSTAFVIIGAVTGAIIGGYIGYQSVVNDPTLTTSQKLAGIGLCAILGGIAGGILGAGLGYALPAMISGGIGSAKAAALVGAVAISVEEAVAMGVVIGVAGVGIMYVKGYGPRAGHNQYENEQFRKAMQELGGYDRTSPEWEKGHRALMKYKKSGRYIDKYKDLLDFLKNVINKKG